jgi:glycosyltransferase involved in cell wall biosynthesis
MTGPLILGLPLLGGGQWTGGETYLRNMLGIIAEELDGRLAAQLFLPPDQTERLESLSRFLARPAVVDAAFAPEERKRQLLRTLLTGRNDRLAGIYAKSGVDVAWESTVFLGRRFPCPVLSWIWDFQHRHLPHFFSRREWWRREVGFRIKTGSRRTIMLSSTDAQRDCERFYPASRGRTEVVRFAIDLDPAEPLQRRADVRARYQLPERFIYLPNQFWSHKNHGLVCSALATLRRNGSLARCLPIIMTGQTRNARATGYFDRLMATAAEAGVASHFRHLGLVPYEDVLALNAACDGLLNPSLFEGWSTTVEEAKALGSRTVLSDIAVHREQSPRAVFFDPHDAEDLAARLHGLSTDVPHVRADLSTLRSAHRARRTAYATSLLQACRSAIALGSPAQASRLALAR